VKIQHNRERDRKIHRALRRRGWVVKRLWGHQISNNAPLWANVIATLAKRHD
jgi:G:T-mismatch repair DNA endonuclease (very short patch repair protein)